MLAQITLPAKWSYAPGFLKLLSYAPGPTGHPLAMRGFLIYFPKGAPLRGGARNENDNGNENSLPPYPSRKEGSKR